MNLGKLFEKNIKDSIPKDVYYVRIKDSATSFGEGTGTRFTPNNPYDSFMYYRGFLFPLELKSTKSTSISIQFQKQDKGKMIKLNQIKGLTEASKHKGIYAGFIFDFRTSGNTYYMSINEFNLFLEQNNKKSINERDIKVYNGILIDKEIKKVHYRYNIELLLKQIVKEKP